MRDKRDFDGILRTLDGQAPSAYEQLAGDFDFSRYVLHSLRMISRRGEAPEALAVIHVPQLIAGFPAGLFSSPIRRIALEDFLARRLAVAIDRLTSGSPGGANRLRVARPGPLVVPRSSVIVAHDYVEARLTVRLPVREGRVDAERAGTLFFEDLPAVVNASLIYCYLEEDAVQSAVTAMEDSDAIRQSLSKRGFAAFVEAGNGLEVADDTATTMETPNGGPRRGFGIPHGVTLVIGDRHSGRAELLRSIALGIYNAPPGAAGRVVTVPDAVEIVAEPGRAVQRVDLAPFLRDGAGAGALLTTARADAAESQMASVVEALQAGAQTLIVDESRSTPDFLSLDSRLERLPWAAPRRYAALSERVRRFADDSRINWIVGADACAAQFVPVADLVLLIENGRVRDITREAKAAGIEPSRAEKTVPALGAEAVRWVCPSSINPAFGREDAYIHAPETQRLLFGQSIVDLSGIPQIVEANQTRTIGLLLYYLKLRYLDESRTISALLDLIEEDLSNEGLDALSREIRGDLARPRRFEIAAALNRLDGLRVTTGPAAAPQR